MRCRKTYAILTMALLMALQLLFSGCVKSLKSEEMVKPDTETLGQLNGGVKSLKSEEMVKPLLPPQEPPAKGAPSAVQPATALTESPLKDIFFDFDKSNIRGDAQPILDEDLQWLRANQTAQITIEGHCDERGTAEYNLALGERRAKSTRDYLVAAAIDDKRLTVISFGKERPFVLGHDESAWKRNRRAHFVVRER